MKVILIAALSLFVQGAAYSQVQVKPDTTNPEGRISAIAAKFCDMYSYDTKLEAAFIFGSSAMEDYKKSGVEGIRFIFFDGFEKTFWMIPEIKRKVVKIDYLSATKGIIHYSDGSESTSEWFFCSARPVAYQVIKKRKNTEPTTGSN